MGSSEKLKVCYFILGSDSDAFQENINVAAYFRVENYVRHDDYSNIKMLQSPLKTVAPIC